MYQLLGDEVRDSVAMGKQIEEKTPFKVEEDLCRSSKREDVLAWRLSINLQDLGCLGPKDEEEMNVLMEKSDDALSSELEPLLEKNDEMISYTYTYDEGLQKMLCVLIIMNRSNSGRKLKDVLNRLLRI